MKSANFSSPARRFPALVLALVLCCSPALAAAATSLDGPQKADPRIAALLSQLEKVRTFRQVALSPNARQLAWVVDSPSGHSQIEIADLAAPESARQVSALVQPGSCNEGEIAWSPDGEQLAFLSDCESPGQMQIFLASAKAVHSPRKLSDLHGVGQALQWSLDGKKIGFLFVEGATRPAGALDAMKPPAGVMGEDGLEIQRVASIDPGNGALRILSPPNLHVYEFNWSHNSRQLAYVAAAPPGENNWWIAQLYVQNVSAGSQSTNEPLPTPRSILDPNPADSPLHGLQIAVPRWSPDDKYIAFISGLMSDQGATGGDMYLLSVASSAPVPILSSKDSSVTWFEWLPDSGLDDHILTSEVKGGSTQIVTNLRSGPMNCLPGDSCNYAEGIFKRDRVLSSDATLGDGRLEGSLSLSADGTRVAYFKSSFGKAPEVYAGTLDKPVQITHLNDALKPTWGKSESISWTSDAPTGKFDVQGWLLYPANYDPARKYPMIVSVHGGPASALLPRWPGLNFDATAFSPLGYFVLFPNPRGSYGQGEAFTVANRKDFGYGDLHDIVAGVDAVLARYPVDRERIGLTGWSYGGFMTMFAVTQTSRFRAAVAGAGISNWQSYYGQNSIDQWMIPYFGASVYDDPAAYAKSSAINFIRQAKTPTLLVVGDRDGECPAPQSFEFWHALKAQHVAAKLVVYPNEGHRFVSPEHRRDVLDRALQWFEQYMPGQP